MTPHTPPLRAASARVAGRTGSLRAVCDQQPATCGARGAANDCITRTAEGKLVLSCVRDARRARFSSVRDARGKRVQHRQRPRARWNS